ncbi:50S ribosomal protein L9 [candidate division WOR-1 bacterium RIFOXYA12_FULL_52_29]|uniref:Large ribosomal subunit protein bL9 n=1 Tax=candidate division WOR-1 bacterium RIFOXYC12_FULL_54_18 TaxID=1802584 RepID=A0A1F4T758_UNCSA|nr:MAG: 50S ribosomal protein L9 [Alphaproteobacteria bacterium RIFOXYD12_FULL_60_8]OGC11906.1 MAG: 50S ribosomal protein L9 [candidate division WOR-1 bacterium RIFOXYA2_FULL_51_19]OGC17980.1 MAG: 50S ribosomal protein L9 [candidate division WOR-1 bacterium RIFOXYA12_FULL_52_29]OGC26836.1 MAG: 50S ribosomal protein L9 [candidate division WOR-1 bacterium RIFOXYB2_FULL_45_9]OGC28397.1 MAG: 50S ribosomal protein L9 [candidate division WOR-1 bacterium RIFOXYC12_FULL_54_18]OGC31148.1 MAG: 50S ribos
MKVIFVEDDRIEEVSNGYARNFLLPNKLAIAATPAAVISAGKRREKRKNQLDKRKAELQALAAKLTALEINLSANAGEGGRLFGTITTADIAEEIKRTSGYDIDKRKIEIAAPIKMVGEYPVKIKLFHEIAAAPKVIVVAK